MMERHALTNKELSDPHEDYWSTLIARAADNVSRIVQSEIHLSKTASGRLWKNTSSTLWRA